MPLQNVEAREVRRWQGQSATAISTVVDKGGRTFAAFQVSNGYDSWCEVYAYSATGQQVGEGWRVDPKPEPAVGSNKADLVSMCLARYTDGRVVLRVSMTSHMTDTSTGRPYIWSMADILGTGAVYDPQNPEHGDNTVPIVTVPGGGTEVTPEQLQQAVKAALGIPADKTLAQIWGVDGNDWRGVLQGQGEDAIGAMGVLTTANFSAGGSFDVWMQQINTAYTGCADALRDAGLLPNPVPEGMANALAVLDMAQAKTAETAKEANDNG